MCIIKKDKFLEYRQMIYGRLVYIKELFLSSYRATPVLGFLPQELLGTSMYEYYHHDDIPHLAESHKAVLQTSERVTTQVIKCCSTLSLRNCSSR